jgi:hypothetical protein
LNSSPISCSWRSRAASTRFAQRCRRHQLAEAAVEEEARLRRVAGDVEAGVLGGEGEAGEVDVRGDVLAADVDERIGVGTVRAMAHQGPARRCGW